MMLLFLTDTPFGAVVIEGCVGVVGGRFVFLSVLLPLVCSTADDDVMFDVGGGWGAKCCPHDEGSDIAYLKINHP